MGVCSEEELELVGAAIQGIGSLLNFNRGKKSHTHYAVNLLLANSICQLTKHRGTMSTEILHIRQLTVLHHITKHLEEHVISDCTCIVKYPVF